MKIFASGEAQSIKSPGTFLDKDIFCRVVGVADLGHNNSENSFGWSGVKAVINDGKENYVLDFPEEVRMETDDGLLFLECATGECNCWHPSLENYKDYDLYLFDLQ